MSRNRLGRNLRKPITSGWTPAACAQRTQPSRSGATSRWQKRFASAEDMVVATARSDVRLPAAITYQPGGTS